jgi:hypothetical protein
MAEGYVVERRIVGWPTRRLRQVRPTDSHGATRRSCATEILTSNLCRSALLRGDDRRDDRELPEFA